MGICGDGGIAAGILGGSQGSGGGAGKGEAAEAGQEGHRDFHVIAMLRDIRCPVHARACCSPRNDGLHGHHHPGVPAVTTLPFGGRQPYLAIESGRQSTALSLL